MIGAGAGRHHAAPRLAALALFLVGIGHYPAVGAATRPSSPPVIDLHVDLSYRVNFRNGTLARGSGQMRARSLERAGVQGVVLPLFVPKSVSPEGPRATDLQASFERLTSLIPETPPYELPGCAARPHAVRTWLAFEGAAPLASDSGSVARWVTRGARIFGLVHTSDNELAGSSGGPGRGGLTDAGRELVRRIHEQGGILDVSHASDAATDDMLKLGAALGMPVVATHSNARAITPHPRNLTDDQIRAIARTGGVVGINFHSRFLVERGRAHLGDVVRHVRHVMRVAGVDHVAIGSDFEGDILPPLELSDVRGFPRLAQALAASGISEADISKIFGENALRLLCP